MPYDEFEADDPFELVGCEVPLAEEHLQEMAECFIEEFARMGYGADHLFGLFCNPSYRGPYAVYLARGEDYLRDLIEMLIGERPERTVQNGLVNIQPMSPSRLTQRGGRNA